MGGWRAILRRLRVLTFHVRIAMALAVGLVGWGVGGCGFSELSNFNGAIFDLPEQKLTLSSDDPQWVAPADGTVPDVTCGVGRAVADCCTPGPGVVVDCQTYPLTCDNGQCSYPIEKQWVQPVMLGTGADAGASVLSSTLSSVYVRSLTYRVNNQLDTAMPPVDLYLGPSDAVAITHPSARKLVTLPAAPANHVSSFTIVLSAAEQQVFSSFARNLKTPFNLIAHTAVVVTGKTPAPHGRAELSLAGQVQAKF